MTGKCRIVFLVSFALAVLPALAHGAETPDPRLKNLPMPLNCDLGKDCFVQNLPDLDPGPAISDSFCGKASYDGHQGTDIRIVSIADMRQGKDVLAILPCLISAMETMRISVP